MSREDIIESMARTIWVSAYASYADENPRKKIPRARGGADWMDVAPNTPSAAERAAEELAELYEAKNKIACIEELAERAAEADGVDAVDQDSFGHYLVMMAMGEGVSWFDDHKRFEFEKPRFEAYYDGRSLEWSGESIVTQRTLPGVNPGRSMMTSPSWDSARQNLAGAAAGTRKNPRGLTAKGERMYEHIKHGYGADPRGSEIAARTVLARSKDVPGLRRGNPPNVLPVPGQRIRSWDHGDGRLVKICEEGVDGTYTATIQLPDGRKASVPLTRTEYDLAPRKVLEKRTGFSRHEQFIAPPQQPERYPRGTPMELEDTVLVPRKSNPKAKR